MVQGTLLYKYSTLMVRVAAAGPRVGVVVIVSRKISIPPLGQRLASVLQATPHFHSGAFFLPGYQDLVLAVRSAYFIGNPASSFSANVVMIRRALGAAPESTNLRVLDFPRPGSFNEQFA